MSLRPTLEATASLPRSIQIEGTRRRILEVSLHLFASRGFAGTSVRDIATALELQPSALYSHFPSKEHVLAELARLGHEAHEAGVRAAFDVAGADPIAQLRAIVRANALLHATYPHLAVVVNEELHSLPAELAAHSLAIRARVRSLLVEVVKRGVDAGLFATLDVPVTSAAIGAMGARIPYWHPEAKSPDASTLADIQAELAVRMVGADQSRPARRPRAKPSRR